MNTENITVARSAPSATPIRLEGLGGRPWRGRRGFSLVEGILGLAILATVTLGGIRYVANGIQEETARGQATRWVGLTRAADNYLKAEDGVIRSALGGANGTPGVGAIFVPLVSGVATSGGGSLPSLPNFRDAGVLGNEIQDNNREKQKTGLLIFLPPGQKDYEAFLVSTGGSAVTDETLTRAEGMSESRIGALLTKDPQGNGAGASARGAKGGWLVPVADLNAYATQAQVPGTLVSPGHFLSYVTMEKRGLADAGRYLARNNDPNPENNTMRTDIFMAGTNGIDGVDHICGAAQGGTPSPYDKQCDGTRLLKIGGDVTTNGGIFAAHDVRSDNAMVAQVFYQGDANGNPSTAFPVQPAGTSKMNILQPSFLDVDTIAYSSQGSRPSLLKDPTQGSSTVRLSDLLPKEVIKASYIATDNNIVPKPDCHDGKGTSHAKIFAALTRVYNEQSPLTTVKTSVEYRPVNVVTSYSVSATYGTDSNGNSQVTGYNTSVTTDTVNSYEGINSDSQVQAAANYTEITAVDQGSQWLLRLPSMTTTPDAQQGAVSSGADPTDPANTGLYKPVDGSTKQNQALIQVLCSYN